MNITDYKFCQKLENLPFVEKFGFMGLVPVGILKIGQI